MFSRLGPDLGICRPTSERARSKWKEKISVRNLFVSRNSIIFAYKLKLSTKPHRTMPDRIDQLRATLHHHNYLYYVENRPEITDREFDELMHELQALEAAHPERYDPNSPTQPNVRTGGTRATDALAWQHVQPRRRARIL